MTLQNLVQDVPPFSSKWPPDVSEITIENAQEIVPVELFNSMAWILGFLEELCLDRHASLSKNLMSKFCRYVRILFTFLQKGKHKHLSIFHLPRLSIRLQDLPRL